jgi:hypothetical protein
MTGVSIGASGGASVTTAVGASVMTAVGASGVGVAWGWHAAPSMDSKSIHDQIPKQRFKGFLFIYASFLLF